MIEAVMYAAIGFLTATLFALLILPAVWRRAVRLTRRRVEGAIPVTLAEIQADKDQLRAEFAVETRRLEGEVDTLYARTAEHWERIVRQDEELRTRKAAFEDLASRFEQLQQAHAALTEHDARLDADLRNRTTELTETRSLLDWTRGELATTRQALDEATARADGLEVDNAALVTLRDTLKNRVSDLDRHLATTSTHLAEERARLRDTVEALAAEKQSTADLSGRLAALQAAHDAAFSRAELLATELAALKIEAENLSERTRQAEHLRDETLRETARQTGEAFAARDAAQAAARHANDQVQMLRAELGMLEGALAKARAERQSPPPRAGTPASGVGEEAADAAQLRGRIGEMAAQVAAMVAALEGPASPINKILAGNGPARNGAGPQAAAQPASPLADRIRALQEQARQMETVTLVPPERAVAE